MQKKIRVISLLTLLLFLWHAADSASISSRKEFYTALTGRSEALIDKVLTELEKGESTSLKRAYEGAMMMRKAHFLKGPANKLRLFKEGHQQFETEIARNPENAEYRFIRFCIQENAPKILKYNTDLQTDLELIVEKYQTMPEDLKEEVMIYAKVSGRLHPEDLN